MYYSIKIDDHHRASAWSTRDTAIIALLLAGTYPSAIVTVHHGPRSVCVGERISPEMDGYASVIERVRLRLVHALG